MKAILWYCSKCNNNKVSFSREPHTMNICECGSSGMDLEEYYSRLMGSCTPLLEFDDNDYPFGLELFICCREQGFNYWDEAKIEKLKEELYIAMYYPSLLIN